MTGNPHFETAPSWKAARAMLAFQPLEPKYTAGLLLQPIRIHVRDHKLRELSVDDRTLTVSYGRDAQVAGCAARAYDLGPEPAPDDIDGRSPAAVAWHDADMFYLIASDEMPTMELARIAGSLYE